MKTIKKILTVAFAFGLLISLIACETTEATGNAAASKSTSAKSSSSITSPVVYKGTVDETGVMTITFNTDNTFVMNTNAVTEDDGFKLIMDLDVGTGTFTGDPSTDGDITLKILKITDVDSDSAGDIILTKMTRELTAGNTTFSITNEDLPLVNYSGSAKDQTETFTISGGKLNMDGVILTRQ